MAPPHRRRRNNTKGSGSSSILRNVLLLIAAAFLVDLGLTLPVLLDVHLDNSSNQLLRVLSLEAATSGLTMYVSRSGNG